MNALHSNMIEVSVVSLCVVFGGCNRRAGVFTLQERGRGTLRSCLRTTTAQECTGKFARQPVPLTGSGEMVFMLILV